MSAFTTEREIEVHAERRVDALDREYLTTGMSQDEYQRRIGGIDLEFNLLMQSLQRSSAR